MHNMLVIVIQAPAKMSKTKHAGLMGSLPRQHSCSAWRTGRCRRMHLTKEDSLLCKSQQIRCGHVMSVGPEVPSGIMRMHIDDVHGRTGLNYCPARCPAEHAGCCSGSKAALKKTATGTLFHLEIMHSLLPCHLII